MRTKKEILRWWKSLRGRTENIIDYQDFYKKIDKSLTILEKQKGTGAKQEHLIIIMSTHWKYPLRLYFYDLECYKIVGF